MTERMRILIRAPNWLGDLVMALPALRAVRQAHPSDMLAVAAPAALAPLVPLIPGVDEAVALPAGRRAAAAALARGRYDRVILLPNSFASAWAARRAGIPERWGYRADLRGWLLTRSVRRPSRRRVRHQAAYYGHLVEALGMPAVVPGFGWDSEVRLKADTTGQEPSQPDVVPGLSRASSTPAWLDIPPALRDSAADLLRQAGWRGEGSLVALAPGAAYGHAKRWPPARFAELAAALVGGADLTCVLVGTAADRDAGHTIESWLAARAAGGSGERRVVSLIGRTDLRQLAGVLAVCRACVSNDSGAMHLASAAGVPVVGLFGPTDERATHPIGPHRVIAQPVWCRPCHLRDCPIDHRCMKRIAVPPVLEAVAAAVADAPLVPE